MKLSCHPYIYGIFSPYSLDLWQIDPSIPRVEMAAFPLGRGDLLARLVSAVMEKYDFPQLTLYRVSGAIASPYLRYPLMRHHQVAFLFLEPRTSRVL